MCHLLALLRAHHILHVSRIRVKVRHETAMCLKFQFASRSQYTPSYLLIYLLTYSMVQSPSWEANWFAAGQEIPCISQNPKVHYRTHKRPPHVYILGQPNPVHIPTSHLLEIHPNIIHHSTPRSPQLFLPSGFPTKTLYTPSPHPYAPHAQPISFFSILSPAQNWVRSISHLAPRYSTLLVGNEINQE